jgi:hypothetical protein
VLDGAVCIFSQLAAMRSRSSGLSLIEMIFSPDMSSFLTSETEILCFAFSNEVLSSPPASGNASARVNVLDVVAWAGRR